MPGWWSGRRVRSSAALPSSRAVESVDAADAPLPHSAGERLARSSREAHARTVQLRSPPEPPRRPYPRLKLGRARDLRGLGHGWTSRSRHPRVSSTPAERGPRPGSFFVVTLPLVAFSWGFAREGSGDAALVRTLPVQAYLALFGLSHFFITFTVYLHRDHRAAARDLLRHPGRHSHRRRPVHGAGVGEAARRRHDAALRRHPRVRLLPPQPAELWSPAAIQGPERRTARAMGAPRRERVLRHLGGAAAGDVPATGHAIRAHPGDSRPGALIGLGGVAILAAYARAWWAGASGRDLSLALGYWATQTAAVTLGLVCSYPGSSAALR
jgi:hypothetical protein